MIKSLKPVSQTLTEKQIEQRLCRKVNSIGGIAFKFNTPGRRAAPDRLCILPQGLCMFVECKRPDKKPTKAQTAELEMLRRLGHAATFVSTYKEVDQLIEQILKILRSAP